MFEIRDTQMAIFERLQLERFVPDLIVGLRNSFPDELEDVPDKLLWGRIEDGIKRAFDYQLVSLRDVSRFLNLQVVYGWHFDTEHPWMAEYLDDHTVPEPSARLDRLVQASVDKLKTQEQNARLRRRFGA